LEAAWVVKVEMEDKLRGEREDRAKLIKDEMARENESLAKVEAELGRLEGERDSLMAEVEVLKREMDEEVSRKAVAEDEFKAQISSLEECEEELVAELEKAKEEKVLGKEEVPYVKPVEPSGGEGWWKEDVIRYRVRKGDSLSMIAAKNFVYGDMDFWKIVYNYNLNRVTNPCLIYPDQVLLIPTVISNDEMQIMSLKKKVHKDVRALRAEKIIKPWVIHVGSYITRQEAEVDARRVRAAGKNAYITEFDLEGIRWHRLRVGFYSTEKEARRYAEEISERLDIEGIWVVKPSSKEIKSNLRINYI
jgi:LysM repeat protein